MVHNTPYHATSYSWPRGRTHTHIHPHRSDLKKPARAWFNNDFKHYKIKSINLRFAVADHNLLCTRLGQGMVGAQPEVDKYPREGNIQHLVVDIVRHLADTHPGVDRLPVEVDTVLVEVDNLFKTKVLVITNNGQIIYHSLGKYTI